MSFTINKVQDFAEIETEFTERINRMVWCNAANVDQHNRPRSRVLHPLWDGLQAWVGTYRHSPKSQQLAHSPYLSLAYVAEPFKPVYVDCTVEWVDDMAESKRLWEWFKTVPEPMGYDPSLIFKGYDDPSFGFLKLTPQRIEVYTLGVGTKIWYAPERVMV